MPISFSFKGGSGQNYLYIGDALTLGAGFTGTLDGGTGGMRNGLTYCAGNRRTSCPSAWICRAM